MDFEKINADDTLNQGRIKINNIGEAVKGQVSELKSDLVNLDNKFTIGKNLINVDELSPLGEWCNYTTGIIESNSYVKNYRHTTFIKVEPSTYYSRRYSLGKNSSVVYFDNSKKYIGYSSTDIFQTPNECAYVIVNIRNDIEPNSSVLMIKGNEVININTSIYPTPPYYEDFKYPNPAYVKKTDKDYVVVAKNGGDYTTVKEAFAYAREHDLEVFIMPGEYDLVAEGISGNGYILPKKVTGYNATLKCHLPSENWELSPLNTDYRYDAFEVYGLTVDIENCRYCIHDEMGARTTKTYKNVFKDLHLINRSSASDVLIAPNNIGGGCGNGGYIEITNCVMEQLGGHTKNIDYHSSFTGNQTGEVIIKMTGCYLDNRVTVSSVGSARENHNKMYVSNCKISTLPTDEVGNNFDMIAWNNVQ